MKPKYEISEVLNLYKEDFLQNHKTSSHNLRTLNALQICRTSVLGGHVLKCKECSHVEIRYNSCRNRHCPKCQQVAKERWIMERESELLDIPYFHIVFTIPHGFNPLARRQPKQMYNALFRASWGTINTFASDPKHIGAKSGMSTVLHTWGQQLSLHPHVHCIVPGGGINPQGKWVFPKKYAKKSRRNIKYLFPKKALSKVFRAKFMEEVRKELEIPQHIAKVVMSKDWVVYAKRPFLGPKQVIEYLGRYTHKIAISNHRLVDIAAGKVTFKYKDYKTEDFSKTMTLNAAEFIRRFCLHILPSGFMKMRHYGILSSRNKSVDLNKAKEFFGLKKWEKQKINWEIIAKQKLKINPFECKKCGQLSLEIVQTINADRGPPLKTIMQQCTS